MNNQLKIGTLKSASSLVELKTSELNRINGGDASLIPLLTNILSHPDTQISYGTENGIPVFRAVLLLPGVKITQSVDEHGATQIVYS